MLRNPIREKKEFTIFKFRVNNRLKIENTQEPR